MNLKKVIYHQGNNKLFDYFILKQKSEIKINNQSLAYQFDTTSDTSSIINQASIQGNFDLVLEKRTKNGNFKGLEPCDLEDIECI